MTTPPIIATLTDARTGQEWGLVSVATTSDGFKQGTAFLIDPETGDAAEDGDGYPIVKSLFLGRAN